MVQPHEPTDHRRVAVLEVLGVYLSHLNEVVLGCAADITLTYLLIPRREADSVPVDWFGVSWAEVELPGELAGAIYVGGPVDLVRLGHPLDWELSTLYRCRSDSQLVDRLCGECRWLRTTVRGVFEQYVGKTFIGQAAVRKPRLSAAEMSDLATKVEALVRTLPEGELLVGLSGEAEYAVLIGEGSMLEALPRGHRTPPTPSTPPFPMRVLRWLLTGRW